MQLIHVFKMAMHIVGMTNKRMALGTSAGLGSSAHGEARQTTSPIHHKIGMIPQKGPSPRMKQSKARFTGLVQTQCHQGKKHYDRNRDLPGLLHLFPAEVEKLDDANKGAILHRIILALRAERKRGRSGHWRYSLARHIALMQAACTEKARCCGHPVRSGIAK